MTQRSQWDAPEVRTELAAWARRLSAAGLETDVEALQDTLHPFVVTWARAHRAARRPFVPYYSCCGTAQSWRLFIAPNRFPLRFSVDLQRQGGWEPAYREHSQRYTWMRSTLTTDRMRALVHLYGRPGHEADLERLSLWFRDSAAREFPDVTALRLRHVRARLPDPEELRAGEHPPGEVVSDFVRGIAR